MTFAVMAKSYARIEECIDDLVDTYYWRRFHSFYKMTVELGSSQELKSKTAFNGVRNSTG